MEKSRDMYLALKNRLSMSNSPTTMEPASKSAEQLRKRIAETEEELKALREQLAQVEVAEDGKDNDTAANESSSATRPERQAPERRKTGAPVKTVDQSEAAVWKWPLRQEEYERYGRQLILPQVGIHGT